MRPTTSPEAPSALDPLAVVQESVILDTSDPTAPRRGWLTQTHTSRKQRRASGDRRTVRQIAADQHKEG